MHITLAIPSQIQILTRKEVSGIIREINEIREKLIASLIYGTGLRASEIIRLRISDINPVAMQICIASHDKIQSRKIYISHNLCELIEEYYRQYIPSGYLFYGINRNVPFKTSDIYSIIRGINYSSRISKRITVSSLRYSFAMHLLSDGASLLTVRFLMGIGGLNKNTAQSGIRKISPDAPIVPIETFALVSDEIENYIKIRKLSHTGNCNHGSRYA